VVFSTYNVEDSRDADMVDKYGAYTLSVFINTRAGGVEYIEQFYDLWMYVGDSDTFAQVVKDRIRARLDGTG
jgi:hypothetical protein